MEVRSSFSSKVNAETAGQKWLGLAWKIARQDSFRSAKKKSRKYKPLR